MIFQYLDKHQYCLEYIYNRIVGTSDINDANI